MRFPFSLFTTAEARCPECHGRKQQLGFFHTLTCKIRPADVPQVDHRIPKDPAPTPAPTLEDVLVWRDRATITLATHTIRHSEATVAAMDAVHELAQLARLALARVPLGVDLRWSMDNDPHCQAAFTEGRRQASNVVVTPELLAALSKVADQCERWIANHGWTEGFSESDAALKLVRRHRDELGILGDC